VSIVSTIHFVLAFLVLLCALVFSWNSRGRRVMNAVLGLQILCGIAYAGTLGMQHIPMPPAVGSHIAGAFVALAAYIFARRLGDRPGGERLGLVLSIVGLLCICATLFLGLHMAGQV
jgi:hypothetical protein